MIENYYENHFLNSCDYKAEKKIRKILEELYKLQNDNHLNN